jgi:hypothetical protein
MKLEIWKPATVGMAILFVCSLARGQGKPVDLEAGSVGISFVPPTGLQPFSEQKTALIREKGIPAKFIFSDPQSDVTVVINTFGSNASEKGLSEVADQIKAGAQKQNTRVELLKQDFITINSQKWLRLSFKGSASDGELIDTYFVTDWAGEYVLFDFSSTAAKYDNYKGAFERSARSIRLGFIATSIELNGSPRERPRKKPRRGAFLNRMN